MSPYFTTISKIVWHDVQERSIFFGLVNHTLDIKDYKGKYTFQNREWNKMIDSEDKIKVLHKVADLAMKSPWKLPTMPNDDADDETFKTWKVHRTLKFVVCEICCNTFTMQKSNIPRKVVDCLTSTWNWIAWRKQDDIWCRVATKKRRRKHDCASWCP